MISPPDHCGHGEISVREPERLFQQSESSSADMDRGFGEARHEHIRIEDGCRIFERWRTLTREPQAPQQMMEELNNTVDALIAQLTQVHGYLQRCHGDINRIINAGNKCERLQGDMSRVLQGHEERLQRIESLDQHLKQHQEYSQQYFVHKEVHAASVQGVEQMCTSATQNIESVRGQVTQLHGQFRQQQEHIQQHLASKDVLEARIKGTEQYCQTSVSVLASQIPQHVENHLQSHASLIHDIVEPLLHEQRRHFDSCMNDFKRVCNERIDSSVHELTSFVKTFVHESCENIERKAIEAARRHVVTVCEPFATQESSLLHDVTCRMNDFESRVKTMIVDSCDVASCHLAIEAGAQQNDEKFGTITREFERIRKVCTHNEEMHDIVHEVKRDLQRVVVDVDVLKIRGIKVEAATAERTSSTSSPLPTGGVDERFAMHELLSKLEAHQVSVTSDLTSLDTKWRACIDAKLHDLVGPLKKNGELVMHFIEQLVPSSEMIGNTMEDKFRTCAQQLLLLQSYGTSYGDVCARVLSWEERVGECEKKIEALHDEWVDIDLPDLVEDVDALGESVRTLRCQVNKSCLSEGLESRGPSVDDEDHGMHETTKVGACSHDSVGKGISFADDEVGCEETATAVVSTASVDSVFKSPLTGAGRLELLRGRDAAFGEPRVKPLTGLATVTASPLKRGLAAPIHPMPGRTDTMAFDAQKDKVQQTRAIFSLLESLEDSPGDDAVRGRVGATIRGLFAGTGDDKEFKFLDQETRKSMHRFMKRPTWNGDYALLANCSVEWNWWLDLFGSALDSDVQAILLLSAIPEKEAHCFLECMIYLGWSYQDIWGILSAEGKDLVNPDVVEDDWEDSTPDEDDVLSYRRWFTSWCVKLAKVGEVTNRHAKKRYTRALSRAGGRYEEPLKDLVEEEELRGCEYTYMEAHNFIFPKLLTTRRVDAIHGYRQGTSSVNRIEGGKGGGPRRTRSAPGYRNKKGDQHDRPQCTHCQGHHSSDNCYLKYPEKCDWLQKVLQQFPQRKKQMLDRWKQRKCIHCGKDRHPKGTRCSQDPLGHPEEKKQGGGADSGGEGRRCHKCRKTGHLQKDCPSTKKSDPSGKDQSEGGGGKG